MVALGRVACGRRAPRRAFATSTNAATFPASIRTECGSTFLLRDRIFETIDFPGGVTGGGTLVMNNNGFLVGGFIDAKGSEHGFIAR